MKRQRNNALKNFSRRAKEMKKAEGCTHTQALELLAQELGYDSYHEARKEMLADE